MVWKTKGRWFDSISKQATWWNGRHGRLKIYSSFLGIGSSPIVGKYVNYIYKMFNKSKKLLKLGNFVYTDKIQILLIDTDKLLFLRKYKNVKDLIKIGLKDKRIYRLLFELIKYKIKYIINNKI